MDLTEIARELQLELRAGSLRGQVGGGYASDMMSDVIANAHAGDLWVTLQTHQNIVAVASMKELAGIVLVGGREPEPETLQRAEEENIPLMISTLPAFELIGRLYSLGLSGLRG